MPATSPEVYDHPQPPSTVDIKASIETGSRPGLGSSARNSGRPTASNDLVDPIEQLVSLPAREVQVRARIKHDIAAVRVGRVPRPLIGHTASRTAAADVASNARVNRAACSVAGRGVKVALGRRDLRVAHRCLDTLQIHARSDQQRHRRRGAGRSRSGRRPPARTASLLLSQAVADRFRPADSSRWPEGNRHLEAAAAAA